MLPLFNLVQPGAGQPWLFVPSAIALGALHGLEPGHSKTMMAAFIVAVRGTIAQAILLGLSATLSHTLIVWLVALLGLYFGGHWNTETSEPYFQLGSAVLIISVALWMVCRTWREQEKEKLFLAHQNVRGDNHDHHHERSHHHAVDKGENVIETLGYKDAHELAHASDIRRRFANRHVTTGQIVIFGLTSGLLPCPAAITVLLLCLQMKKFILGVTLVLCFSIGLAVTMVAAGTVAALGVRHFSRRWSGFGAAARRAPYLSSFLIIGVGFYTGLQAWMILARS
jgi:nickel/cobalt exporter